MNDADLREKLILLKSGNMKAFDEIYSELKTPVFTVIMRTGCDWALAEDVMQELFVKLFRSKSEEIPAKPRAYLFKCARNLAIDSLRKQPQYAGIDDICEYVPTKEQSQDEALDLERAMARLKPADRQIITLHINASLTFREIADITEKPLGTVLWRYRKAIGMLRDMMDGG